MYFQNPLNDEFRGNWVLGDRQYSLTFICLGNKNIYDNMITWTQGPYDLSASGLLTINYAWDVDFKIYSELTIDVTGADPTATTASEIVNILNANATFSSMWVASLNPNIYAIPQVFGVRIAKKSGRVKQVIRVYISNTGAEAVLNFNGKAGVAELPTYFERHTIANRFAFSDSLATLVALDPSNPIDAQIITNAGFDPTVVLEDWQLLSGRSGIFNFQKITVDGSDRITEIIQYPAGSVVGAFARKIQYTYTAANKNPSQITEIPYVLTSGDLITP